MNKKHKKISTICIAAALFVFVALFAKTIWADDVSVDVSSRTNTVILKDSDGDGLLDGEDPHPDIAEIYIVEDKDKNGIVDSFENDSTQNNNEETENEQP